ncbi:cache domain-containing protein [Massilia glaciei]|uniref:Histidine kinase n=1 Tax=Massilia glaciei TaxID=1524097 RepID=A0A2U2HLR4_9BURK|nr:cache domain-containing protein [Massilia glaciei]PWF48461.1 histidine kinase [Massilia glaciei]
MKTALAALLLLLNFLTSPPAAAAPKGTPGEAVAMTKRAIALIASQGHAKAFAEFADPANAAFHDRDLYVFVYDMDGVAVAHGVNPKMVGKNLRDMRDIDGKYIIRGFIGAAQSPAGSAWVEYKWPNPATKTVEPKAACVERTGDLIVGAGVYK